MFRKAAAFGLATLACLLPSPARGQACCAGGSAVTPARLELHENALAGIQLRGAYVHGSYTPEGGYLPSPAGDSELDFEEDLFAAARVLRRAQIALLVPLVQTYRHTPQNGGFLGGGIGDVNASVRYDAVIAGEHRYVPGIAILGGLTVPTGTAPESDTRPLDVGATGIGAWQLNGALALEQVEGPWLFNATAIVAARTPRFGETLGTQVTLLAAGAYTFDSDVAVALSASYAFEGDATTSGGADVAGSSKRLTVLTLSVLWPMSDAWRLLGGLYLDPPLGAVGSNQPALTGLTVTIIRSWT